MKFLLSLSSSVLISAILLSVLPLSGEEEIYSDVIRLHVIAQSDSEYDQSLKLEVRDAVLELLKPKLTGIRDYDKAYAALSLESEEIQKAAENVLASHGKDSSVTVSLCREAYPRREYDSITLPAGEYTSLKVSLGKAEGKNWWCLLFPSMCVRYAKGEEEAKTAEESVEASLTPQEYRIITKSKGKYKVKLRILEIFSEIFDFSR